METKFSMLHFQETSELAVAGSHCIQIGGYAAECIHSLLTKLEAAELRKNDPDSWVEHASRMIEVGSYNTAALEACQEHEDATVEVGSTE